MSVFPIHVLLLDDEPASLEASGRKIAMYVPEDHIHMARTAMEAMQMLKTQPIALAFLDVEMPETNGFSVAEFLHTSYPEVRYVFLTGHAEMGAKSYDYEPLDFLCKPLDVVRLQKTFERFERTVQTPPSHSKIAVATASGFVLMDPADILYLTIERRRTMLYTHDQVYLVKSTLDELEMMFEEYGLFRCHQSYIINLNHVTGVTRAKVGRTYLAILDHETQIPVSRSKYSELRDRLQQSTPFV